MRYGIDLMNFGEYINPSLLVRLAQAAEAAGWEALFLWDHLGFVWGPASGDPWIMLTTVAGKTTQLKLGTSISPLPRYRPHLLAQTLTTLDIMSGGRVVLGVGLGAVAQEYTAFGESEDHKVHAAMVDEGLAVLNQLWSGDLVVHHGTYYTVDHVRLQPVPVQRPRIPVWVGGESKAALRRAGRWDGWIATGIAQDGSMTKTPEDIARSVAEIRQHRPKERTFDIVLTGYSTPTDGPLVREYENVGVTWWLESLHGFRGSVEEMIMRVVAGPPR